MQKTLQEIQAENRRFILHQWPVADSDDLLTFNKVCYALQRTNNLKYHHIFSESDWNFQKKTLCEQNESVQRAINFLTQSKSNLCKKHFSY
jgi:hypothetical protein